MVIHEGREKMKKYIINPKTFKKSLCSSERMDGLVRKFKYNSWFTKMDEMKDFIRDTRKKKILITKNWESYGCYDVWAHTEL